MTGTRTSDAQVTLCDPIWHVISRSGVVISITNCYIRVYFTLLQPKLVVDLANVEGCKAELT